jgi:transposase
VEALIAIVSNGTDDRIPSLVRSCLMALSIQAQALRDQIRILDRRLVEWYRSDETCKRLDAIPGVGPALATALVASVADPKAFRSGRDFSAWIGLVPKQNSSE